MQSVTTVYYIIRTFLNGGYYNSGHLIHIRFYVGYVCDIALLTNTMSLYNRTDVDMFKLVSSQE